MISPYDISIHFFIFRTNSKTHGLSGFPVVLKAANKHSVYGKIQNPSDFDYPSQNKFFSRQLGEQFS